MVQCCVEKMAVVWFRVRGAAGAEGAHRLVCLGIASNMRRNVLPATGYCSSKDGTVCHMQFVYASKTKACCWPHATAHHRSQLCCTRARNCILHTHAYIHAYTHALEKIVINAPAARIRWCDNVCKAALQNHSAATTSPANGTKPQLPSGDLHSRKIIVFMATISCFRVKKQCTKTVSAVQEIRNNCAQTRVASKTIASCLFSKKYFIFVVLQQRTNEHTLQFNKRSVVMKSKSNCTTGRTNHPPRSRKMINKEYVIGMNS